MRSRVPGKDEEDPGFNPHAKEGREENDNREGVSDHGEAPENTV